MCMSERGNAYALSALKKKRAAIASEIIQLERQVRHRKDMLAHVDATLRILDPSIQVDAIPNKRIVKNVNIFRQGELGQLLRNTMRVLDRPATTPEIVDYIIKTGGHGKEARAAIRQRVRSNLSYLARRGKVAKEGEQREARWRLV